jgi:hypothetical protein
MGSREPVFNKLANVVDNKVRQLQVANVGHTPDKSVSIPAEVMRAVFNTHSMDLRTPTGLLNCLTLLLTRDFILRVSQVSDLLWCVKYSVHVFPLFPTQSHKNMCTGLSL